MPTSVVDSLNTVSALPYTSLSLSRYARILGLNPVHFWMAYGFNVFPIDQGCSDLWVRHSWQAYNTSSHEELLRAIKTAEDDISRYIGYPVAPRWIANETHDYPQYHRPEYTGWRGINARGLRKSSKARWMKVRRVGRRNVTAIETGATVVYTDEDGDGLFETATITATTTETDACEIKVYHAGTNGDQRWEIRFPRSIDITAGTVTIVLDSWLLIDPDLLGVYPNPEGIEGIDIETNISNFVTTVDLYKEFADTTQASCQFSWEPEVMNSLNLFCPVCSGSGCEACTPTIQDGCLTVRDNGAGVLVGSPAAYDADTGLWSQQPFSVCRDPDQIKLWYVAGDVSEEYENGYTCDPLSTYWAETIAMLATARLEHEFCGCGRAAEMAEHWRLDVSRGSEDVQFVVDFGMLSNPFGTRIGEVRAWQRVDNFSNTLLDSALI